MDELVITRVNREGALPEGEGAYVEVETQVGPLQLRFTLEDAERLIAALHGAKRRIQLERERAGLTPLPETPRVPERWDTGLDPIDQVAILKAHFPGYTVEAQIARPDIPRIARFLEDAYRRFEASADMRQ